MSRIFISYKRVDKDNVYKIKEQIESSLGEKCWMDIDGIESDAQFMNVIVKAINDCEIVLFMYSKAHSKIVDFEKDWTVRELNFASKKNKRIVFINIDGSPLTDAFEFVYGTKQQIDGRNKEVIKKLCVDLQKWLQIKDSKNGEKTDNTDNDSFPKDVAVRTFHFPKCKSKINGKVLMAFCVVVAIFGVGWLLIKLYFKPTENYLTSDILTIDGVKLVMKPIFRTDGAESFYISQTEVTQDLWTVVMGDNPSKNKGDSLPVSNVSWYDCIEFCIKLSEKTGLEFNLPTKEQWMFAAMAKDTLKYCGSDSIDEVAWFADNTFFTTTKQVALKKPNAYGLYDMSGNVSEWCLDSLSQSSLMRVIMGGGITSSSHEVEINHVDYDYVIHNNNIDQEYNGLRIIMPSKFPVGNSTHVKRLTDLYANKQYDSRRYDSLPKGINHAHEWVDLGLPSGTKWATTNIGGETPADYGDFFAWGEIKNCNDRLFDAWNELRWQGLKYYVSGDCGDNTEPIFSKYILDSEHGKIDGRSELDLQDDAAHVNWGIGWRIPSKMQIDELNSCCTWIWSTLFGHHGYKVIGPNGNSIFIPAAGMRCGGWHDEYFGIDGYYWSRTLYKHGDGKSEGAHSISFWETNHEYGEAPEMWAYRYFAYRIRPVLEYE